MLDDSNLDLGTLPMQGTGGKGEGRRRGWRLWLSLSLEVEDDFMEKLETLTHKGVFIGLLTGLK